ncbi:MAG: diguanylate cyclase [Nitriliruptoraceae bacterium]|nr:diguanylate cyclase [Nitriliruptoraceae bacterium]
MPHASRPNRQRPAARRAVGRAQRLLPVGDTLSPAVWRARHRWIVGLVWAHVGILPLYALSSGESVGHALSEALPVLVLAVVASWSRLGPTWRSLATTLALTLSSTMLIHISGGMIEMHFHFFVVLFVVSLYQAWHPFLLALIVVVLHHGVVSQFAPGSVYNHPAALAEPWRWAMIHAGFVLAASVVCVVAWRLNEDALDHERRANEELAAAQRIAAIGSFDWDLEADTSLWSDEMYRMLQIEPGTAPSLALFFSRVHPDDHALVRAQIESVYQDAEVADYEHRLVLPDGSERTVHARATLVEVRRGKRAHLRGTFQDITERKELEREIQYRAYYDELTGLANRALFMERLEGALEHHRRSGEVTSVLFLDLDAFKAINDRFGHRAGDELLAETARRLRQACRETDTVARLGGDEFAVLFESSQPLDLHATVGRILRALAVPVELTTCTLPGIAASSGVADTGSAHDSDTLLHHADAAMYRAKRDPAAHVRVFDGSMLDADGAHPATRPTTDPDDRPALV